MREFVKIDLIEAQRPFSVDDWKCIEVYKKRAMNFLEERKKLNLGTIQISISREPDGNLTGSGNIPLERDLKLFYLAFRFFFLEKERSNFNRVSNLIRDSFSNPAVNTFVKKIKEQWKGSFVKNISDFHGRNYSSKEIVDLWFNAHLFHSVEEKEVRLSEINSFLSSGLSQITLFMSVWDAGLSVASLYNSLEYLEKDRGYLTLPKST